MSQSMEVRWRPNEAPDKAFVQQVLRDYLGEDACEIDDQNESTWYVELPSKPSHSMRSRFEGHQVVLRDTRAFEVSWCLRGGRTAGEWGGGITLTQRDQDEFVHAIVEGFARVCKMWFNGRIRREH